MDTSTRPPETIYRARREALSGLPLSEVARRAGLNKGTLSLIEQGRLIPTVDQAEAILSVLEAERWRRDIEARDAEARAR